MAGRKVQFVKVSVSFFEGLIGTNKAMQNIEKDPEILIRLEAEGLILDEIVNRLEIPVSDDNIDKEELTYYRKQAR